MQNNLRSKPALSSCYTHSHTLFFALQSNPSLAYSDLSKHFHVPSSPLGEYSTVFCSQRVSFQIKSNAKNSCPHSPTRVVSIDAYTTSIGVLLFTASLAPINTGHDQLVCRAPKHTNRLLASLKCNFQHQLAASVSIKLMIIYY